LTVVEVAIPQQDVVEQVPAVAAAAVVAVKM
jgi:hypothetical protein